MKASQMIKQLEGLIQKHGDLPLAMMESDRHTGDVSFVESDGVEGVYHLNNDELLYDTNDCVSKNREVFLID